MNGILGGGGISLAILKEIAELKDENEALKSEINKKIAPDAMVNVYNLSTRYGKEDAVNKLDNPLLLTGKEAPYCILFNNYDGSVPGLSGGINCIFGYTYTNGLYAAQIGFNFGGGFIKRRKSNGVWSDWTSV